MFRRFMQNTRRGIMFTEEAERLSRYILAEDSEIEFRIRSGTEMYSKGFGHFVLKDAEGGEVAGRQSA